MKHDIDTAHIRYAQLRLKIWGSWCRQVLSWGLNYPSRSLLYQLVEKKGVLIKDTQHKIVPENQRAEAVDELVEALGKEQPMLAKVLVIHYVEEGGSERKANRTGLSKATYFRYLKKAENEIAFRID